MSFKSESQKNLVRRLRACLDKVSLDKNDARAIEDPAVRPEDPVVAPEADKRDRYDGYPCCESGTCWDCLRAAMREQESGGEVDQCNSPAGDNGKSCGAYQISENYVKSACEVCPALCSAAPYGTAKKVWQKLCSTCPSVPPADGQGNPTQTYDQCCAEKERLAKEIMRCYNLRYGHRPNYRCNCRGKDTFLIASENTEGSHKDGGCCTCEEIARRHQGVPAAPCESTGPGANTTYWNEVKARMLTTCPACVKKKGEGEDDDGDPDPEPGGDDCTREILAECQLRNTHLQSKITGYIQELRDCRELHKASINAHELVMSQEDPGDPETECDICLRRQDDLNARIDAINELIAECWASKQ